MREFVMCVAFAAPMFVLPLASATIAAPADKPVPSVSIKDYAFRPATLTVNAGDTVTFVNNDDETHTATANDNTFDSGSLKEKASFSYTFAKPGTYTYHCKIHTTMKGTIVVNPAGSSK
jgi:plastocyanin